MTNPEKQVAIVTDSAAALSIDQISDLGVFVSRMEITIDDKTFVDGEDPELDDFYSMLERSESIPTTSAPIPGEYLEQYEKAGAETDEILCVSLSARLSAAFDAATVAAEQYMKENPSKRVEVFDTETAASSQALITTAAVRSATSGNSIDQVVAQIEEVANKVRLLAILDTLKFIHRSGRVPKIAFWATAALNIKPVMEYSTGNIGAIARPRTTKRAMQKMLDEIGKSIGNGKAHINVMHAGASDRAHEVHEWLTARFDCEELFTTSFHPFMGAHTGPGLVGASWWTE
jgi:DegV family protein with EDD domain